MEKKIRYGILGFGAFAEKTIGPAIVASPNSALVALQKRSRIAADEKARMYQVPFAFDSAELLAAHPEVDAVYVASAVVQHKQDVLAAARAGKHVLLEKPMALNAAEAEEMINACRQANVKFMVAHLLRFSPALIRMKGLIASGILGPIAFARAEYMYDARLSQRQWLHTKDTSGGGPTFDIGVHCLDTLRFVLNDAVVSVQSLLAPDPTKTATEKISVQNLKFSKGTLANIYASFTAPIRRAFLEVIGQEGLLSLDNFATSSTSVTLLHTTGSHGSIDKIQKESFAIPSLCEQEVTAFSNCILHDTASPVPGEEGLKNQIILDRVLQQ